MKPLQAPEDTRKLREVRPLDQDYLMVFIKDGQVVYRDDATGPSACQGHDFAEGDDQLFGFGHPLDVVEAQRCTNWRIVSEEDGAYRDGGLAPQAIHRKSKPNNADYNWNYKLDHWLFLKLPHPLKQGCGYTLKVDSCTFLEETETPFVYDVFDHLSEAVHVNLVGYPTKAVIKAADLYYWMGDGGARDYSGFEGKSVYLKDQHGGEVTEVGKVTFWKPSMIDVMRRNHTGSSVWNADFTGFRKPGTYRLAIEGVGSSPVFVIGNEVYREPYKTSVRGFYYMRIGEPGKGVTPVPRQPRFIPGVDPHGFRIYLTDVHPWDPEFIGYPADTWDESHHVEKAEDSLFWRRRLPGNPTNNKAVGGHADALDWDRHLAHVSIIYDMLLPYLLSEGVIGDDDLEIRESGNGVPDIIDEARNEVDLWLNIRHGEAYCHGLTNPCRQLKVMFQAGATTMAAWANAANCAMIADAFRVSGHRDLQEHYVREAVTAFRYAAKQRDKQLDDVQNVGDAYMRGRDFLATAAAYLYNATGDREWEDHLARESVVKGPDSTIELESSWTVSGGTEGKLRYSQLWATAGYLLCPHECHYPELKANMKAAAIREAMESCVANIDQRPSRRASPDNHWQTIQNIQIVCLAHKVCEDAGQRQLLEKAMLLESDWGLGRNPSNIVQMTGLGSRCVVNCYTTGRNDGTPGLHPGHTPYWNIEPWSYDHNGGNPQYFVQKCYPDWIMGGWPHQEAHFDNRYSWCNAEFTPQQTMRGKIALYGYLYSLLKEKD
jgi:hypothetical protein